MAVFPVGNGALIQTESVRQLRLRDAKLGSQSFDVDLVFHRGIMIYS